jgi:hypothetical protein
LASSSLVVRHSSVSPVGCVSDAATDTALGPLPAPADGRDFVVQKVQPTLVKGLTRLCKEKPAEPVRWLAEWLVHNNPSQAAAL